MVESIQKKKGIIGQEWGFQRQKANLKNGIGFKNRYPFQEWERAGIPSKNEKKQSSTNTKMW